MGAYGGFRGLSLLTLQLFCPARAHFRCSFAVILPCCSAAWPAPLPLSTFTAFLGFYCLCRSAAWPAPLPLSTFTAFLGFYCLCRLVLNQSTVADFVDFYCLCRLLLPLSTFTACVGFHCLRLILLSLSAILTLTTECRNLLIVSTILL